MSDDDISLSIPETMQELGIGRVLVYREINSGDLDSYKSGKRRLVTKGSIKRYRQKKIEEERERRKRNKKQVEAREA